MRWAQRAWVWARRRNSKMVGSDRLSSIFRVSSSPPILFCCRHSTYAGMYFLRIQPTCDDTVVVQTWGMRVQKAVNPGVQFSHCGLSVACGVALAAIVCNRHSILLFPITNASSQQRCC